MTDEKKNAWVLMNTEDGDHERVLYSDDDWEENGDNVETADHCQPVEDDDHANEDDDNDDDDDDDEDVDDENIGIPRNGNYLEALPYAYLCRLFYFVDYYLDTEEESRTDAYHQGQQISTACKKILNKFRIRLETTLITYPDIMERFFHLRALYLLETTDYIEAPWADAGTNLLGYACIKRCMPIVRILLEYGACVDTEHGIQMGISGGCKTLLNPIITKSSLEVLQYFVEVLDINPNRCTPIAGLEDINNDDDDDDDDDDEAVPQRPSIIYQADEELLKALSRTIFNYSGNDNNPLYNKDTIEEELAKVRYLLIHVSINTYGIFQTIEYICHNYFTWQYPRGRTSSDYRYLLKRFLQIVFNSPACLSLSPELIIQSYLIDYLCESICHFREASHYNQPINSSFLLKDKNTGEMTVPKYVTLEELHYVFNDIVSDMYELTLPIRYVDIRKGHPHYSVRKETVNSLIFGHYNYFDLQHFACDSKTYQLPPWDLQEDYDDLDRQRCYPPSLDLLLYVVEPNDLLCFRYLIEKLQLNPNVIVQYKTSIMMGFRPVTIDHPLALLLRPLPVRTMRYLIEAGHASLDVITKDVFGKKSNLLFHIIQHWKQWMDVLDDEIEVLAIVSYLIDDRGIDPKQVPEQYASFACVDTLVLGTVLDVACMKRAPMPVIKYLVEQCGCIAAQIPSCAGVPLIPSIEPLQTVLHYLPFKLLVDDEEYFYEFVQYFMENKSCVNINAIDVRFNAILSNVVVAMANVAMLSHTVLQVRKEQLQCYIKFAKWLIEKYQADPYIKDRHGSTLFQRFPEIMEMIV